MPFRFTLPALFFLFICANADAQSLLKGKIFIGKTDSALAEVTVFNATRNIYVQAGKNGLYTIAAAEDERIIFSSVGYFPDTIKVLSYMLAAGYDISLRPDNSSLPSVTVFSFNNYQADSARRRMDYNYIFDRPLPLAGRSRPPTGFGVVLSPVSFFSREEKQKRKLKKQLKRQEEESFVDYCFSKAYVEKISGLHGDSLQLFMVLYRPPYSLCRKSGREGMVPYINEKLKLFMKRN